jgi:hypothetical protein
MKATILAVVALISFGSALARAQSFGFASVSGGLYCDYEQLVDLGNGVWGGFENLSACGFSVNATISGFSAAVPKDGPEVHGAGIVYGDSIYAVASPGNFQYTVFTKVKCSKPNKSGQYTGALGWEGIAAFSGFTVGTNFGYLSCLLPVSGDEEVLRRGTIAGKLKPRK